jgi:hypothetical protein
MKEPQYLIWVRKTSDIGIPPGIEHSISESGKDEGQDQDRIWWVEDDYHVCDEMASWSNECHPSLTEVDMYEIVQSSACDVTDEWGQKNERDDDVSDVIIFLKLPIVSASVRFEFTHYSSRKRKQSRLRRE